MKVLFFIPKPRISLPMLLRLLSFAFLITFSLPSLAQITFRITSWPASMPMNDPIYVAGNFNGWQPGLAEYRVQPRADGSYSLTLPSTTGRLEFKFTRGTWDTEEVDGDGQVIPNRRWEVTGEATQDFAIAGWKDLDGVATATPSTASDRVLVWQEAMDVPQLGRERRVWVYLPHGYEEGNQHYPVLYMHDGQNLFDAATGFAGEWSVDELLDSLQLPLIVVGVDNGGEHRINEYTPYRNARRGDGGEGTAYVQFVVETLKPKVDAAFRTRPEAEHTAIMGSSLGSLISLHAAIEYPETFSKLGLLSSALWINRSDIFRDLEGYDPTFPVRAYVLIGRREGPDMVMDSKRLDKELREKDMLTVAYLEVPQGEHNEALWRTNMLAVLQHLYPELF